jgi:type IV secretion system protein VirB10
MVCVILLTSRSTPPDATPVAPKVPVTVDPNQVRIKEYRDRVDEQARRLQAEQAELALAKQALAGSARSGAIPSDRDGSPAGIAPAYGAPEDAAASLHQDQAQREYRALYADNLAWSARSKETTAPFRTGGVTQSPADPETSQPTPRTDVGNPARVPAASGPAAPSRPEPPAPARADAPGSSVSTGSATYTLLEGTVIEAVLTNRLDGSYVGPVNAMVTAPVYSRDVQHLLIPRGSRLLGQATPVTQFGQQRLAVAFHRLVFADGHFVSLERYQALDQVGETGLRDKVDNHYLQTFGAALAVGALAGFAQHDTRVGLDESAGDAYRQGMSSSVTQSSMRILDRFLNRLPTITIREGHRIKVYLSADFSLPEYQELRPNSAPR